SVIGAVLPFHAGLLLGAPAVVLSRRYGRLARLLSRLPIFARIFWHRAVWYSRPLGGDCAARDRNGHRHDHANLFPFETGGPHRRTGSGIGPGGAYLPHSGLVGLSLYSVGHPFAVALLPFGRRLFGNPDADAAPGGEENPARAGDFAGSGGVNPLRSKVASRPARLRGSEAEREPG